MSLLVTGSIGIDTVEAPSGMVKDVLGGSSIYFAYAASFFSPVRLVGVVGEDCPPGFLAPLEKNKRIDLAGLEVRKGSKTFRWHGRYHQDVNERDTIAVDLNVLAERGPTIPPQFRDSRYVFMANTHPALQGEMLGQLDKPALVVADTMDLWINTQRSALMDLLGRLDGLVLNDSEAKLLTGEPNVVAAGMQVGRIVRKFVVIKKGEHGSLLFVRPDGVGGDSPGRTGGKVYAMPSYPTFNVIDPTGAGDTFAGAMMGHLAAQDKFDVPTLRRAIAYGSVTASLELEDFSLNKLVKISRKDIDERMAEFQALASF